MVLHELGHFWTARAFGIKVKEFGIGYPPRILSFKKNNTIYSLNLLPLGGFVKLLGEDDDTDPESFASNASAALIQVKTASLAEGAQRPLSKATFITSNACVDLFLYTT